jgi:hypothetical protein
MMMRANTVLTASQFLKCPIEGEGWQRDTYITAILFFHGWWKKKGLDPTVEVDKYWRRNW